jgi:hypothetical protein
MGTSSTISRFFLRFFGLLLGIIFLLSDASLSNRKGRTGTAALYLFGEGSRCGEPPLKGPRLARADYAMLRVSPSMASKASEGGLNLPARSGIGICAPSTASFSSGSARR